MEKIIMQKTFNFGKIAYENCNSQRRTETLRR